MDTLEKIAFDIGWDHVVHGVPLPECEMATPITDGYKAARLKHGERGARPAERPDRYVKKWLQLRRSAWKRGRIFSNEINPALIRQIDVPFCPVTRLTLTYGTGEDSDWSIDRLDNNGGYVLGNILVMSTRANHLKDRLIYENIHNDISMSKSGITGNYTPELADKLLGTEPLLDDRYRMMTLVAMQRATKYLIPALVHPPFAISSNDFYIGMSILSLKAVLNTQSKQFRHQLKRVDPNPNGLQRLMREMSAYIRDVHNYELNDIFNNTATLLGRENMELRARIYWLSEDIWMPGSPILEYADRWYNSIDSRRYEFLINGLLNLGKERAQTISMDQLDHLIGRDTRGFVEATPPTSTTAPVIDTPEEIETTEDIA